mgnify:CR=1 FL=1
MGEIRSKTCEGRELTKNQLAATGALTPTGAVWEAPHVLSVTAR